MSPSSNAKKTKIFVAGSSWARGEWVGPRVAHRGLVQYFEENNYTVIDSSQARSWHSRVNQLLDSNLNQYFVPGDLVFWIQADPLLDIIMPELAASGIKRSTDVVNLSGFTEQVKQAGGLVALLKQQQKIIYTELNSIAQQHNAQVYCIGGTYNIDTSLLDTLTNLTPLVVSWIDLLIGHFSEYSQVKDPAFGVSYTWGIDYIDLSQFSTEFANQVREEFEMLSKYSYMLKEDIFHPDGLHPNRNGHKILFEHLTKTLNL